MKICVYGAGAIGGYLAVGLATAGHEVCIIARGAHLEAIKTHGLKLRSAGAEQVVRVAASADPSDFGPQDWVLCALKAHQAYIAAPSFAPLLGPTTAVVTAMNGIPWWYFYRTGGRFDGLHPRSVDEDGRQWRAIGPERAIGCVVDPACEVVAPPRRPSTRCWRWYRRRVAPQGCIKKGRPGFPPNGPPAYAAWRPLTSGTGSSGRKRIPC